MRSPHPASRATGFTLVELLTVIAILGVLTVITIPVVGKVRESSRAVQCLGNLRQLQLANLTYAAERRGYVPILLIDSENAGRRTLWYQNTDFLAHLPTVRTSSSVNPLKLDESMQCPTARALANPKDFTYGTNAHGRGGEWTAGLVRQVTKADVQRPARTLAFADGLDWQLYADGAVGYSGDLETLTSSSSHLVAYRHGDRANVVYFDGHTARLSPSALAAGADGRVAELWINRD